MLTDAAIFGTSAVALGLTFVIRPEDRKRLIYKAYSLVDRVRSSSPGVISSR
jgi:hypothetical protein